MSEPPIRPAATVILFRDDGHEPRVLMGQRGAGAAFMPSKFVFPGGAVDPADATVPLAATLPEQSALRIGQGAPPPLDHALAVAAIRELWEETGLPLARPGTWTDPVPAGWDSFAASGLLPSAASLTYIFRAITPPGRPRRFDARFFLAKAEAISKDLENFGEASGELTDLQWLPLQQARRFDLPFITEVVLAEVETLIYSGRPPESVPFFDNSGPSPTFRRIT